MNAPNPSHRILTKFGESDTFHGLKSTDLRILIPAVFLGFVIARNTPPVFATVGWSVCGVLVLGSLLVIYVTPDDQTPQGWLLDRYRFLTEPSVRTLEGNRETPSDVTELRPETDETSTEANGPNRKPTRSTQALTELDRFHLRHDAARRTDGYLFGAVRVTPANMALATYEDWEQTCRSFAQFVNGLDFPFQLYSTVTPVDPSAITQGYRDRLRSGSLDDKPAFRELVRAYDVSLPLEFAHRGTSIREYFVIVPVSQLDVQRAENSIGYTSLLDRLADLPYIGGFVTAIGVSRRGYSAEEVEARQVTELHRRLGAVEEGIKRLPGCDAMRLETAILADLLLSFWDPNHRDTPMVGLRTTPVITTGETTPGQETL